MGQQKRFKAGKANCNPACGHGSSCTRVAGKTGSAFRCSCLLGLSGADCRKVVNFCKTQQEHHVPQLLITW